MQKLTLELKRLYGADSGALGQTRVIALAFRRLPDEPEAGHWERLCTVANALQSALRLPAPAVSISGDGAYGLWLSLAQPVPLAQAQEFSALLCAAYCPEQKIADAAATPPPLPPRLVGASGKWAAFINPGLGASFAGDEGLEVQPPEAGQLALLEGLESISPVQLAHALERLRQMVGVTPQPSAAPSRPANAQEDLLLKDATLEDIVAYLHSKNIEPSFRFLK